MLHFRPFDLPLLLGLALIALLLVCAVAPNRMAPYDPQAFDYNALLAPPGWAHPFGTDQFGRDMLSRTISAAAIDLQIAVFATVGPLVLGSLMVFWSAISAASPTSCSAAWSTCW